MGGKTLNRSKAYAFAAGLGLALLVSGCVQPTPYSPRTEGSPTGYTDEQLAKNRFRVTFAGNSVTPRETVENYLLFRAAQVTLASGYTAFAFDDRDTKAKTIYLSTFNGFPGAYGPYRHFGWYWHNWGFDEDVQSRPITRYEAYAEIVMLTADQAKADPRSLDAQDVLTRLGPRVLPPPPPK